MGVLAALVQRERTGRGQHVEVNLLSSAVAVARESGVVLPGDRRRTATARQPPSVDRAVRRVPGGRRTARDRGRQRPAMGAARRRRRRARAGRRRALRDERRPGRAPRRADRRTRAAAGRRMTSPAGSSGWAPPASRPARSTTSARRSRWPPSSDSSRPRMSAPDHPAQLRHPVRYSGFEPVAPSLRPRSTRIAPPCWRGWGSDRQRLEPRPSTGAVVPIDPDRTSPSGTGVFGIARAATPASTEATSAATKTAPVAATTASGFSSPPGNPARIPFAIAPEHRDADGAAHVAREQVGARDDAALVPAATLDWAATSAGDVAKPEPEPHDEADHRDQEDRGRRRDQHQRDRAQDRRSRSRSAPSSGTRCACRCDRRASPRSASRASGWRARARRPAARRRVRPSGGRSGCRR